MTRTLFALLLAATPALAHDMDTPPPAEVLDLYAVAAAPSPERIRDDIRTLVNFGTRHTLSETRSDRRGIGAARRWIFAEFERISADCGGCLEVMYISDTVAGETRIPELTDVVSVVALQRGTEDTNRMIAMSGDIDSRVTDPLDGTSDSPGANDNASGMAGVLEAARILTQRRYPGTIAYMGLSGEEQGLFGGKIVAEHAKREGWQLTGVLNNDMISNISGIDGVIDNRTVRVFSEGTRATETPEEANRRRFTGGEVDSPSRNLARHIKALAHQYMPELEVKLIYRLDRFRRGGHHRPFNEAGIPGVRIMETHEHYDRQHQDLRVEDGVTYGDTMEGVDADYAAKLTGLNAITLASIAGAPPVPQTVEAGGAVEPSATLSWQVSDAPNLAGYRVHWRDTDSAEWQWSRWVGLTGEWTFENLVIDNYIFGVSAVSEEGYQTPVVFPGDPGRFPN